MKIVLLTGSTGAVGSALVGAFLAEPGTELRLVIRAATRRELHERVERLFRFVGVAPDNATTRARVHALSGDVTAGGLGIATAELTALRSEVTHIVHSAGAVRMNLSIEAARRSAVDSAREIVALAKSGPRVQKVEFVSTVGVGGRMGGLLPETWIARAREFHNTYEQAKAEAEDYVRTEAERGLPLTVHRPSMVVGDSRTGAITHFQVFYHLCEFLSGRRSLGLCPRLGPTRLDTVPADYVARAIAWSSGQATTVGRILHLCSGPERSIALTDLQQVVRMIFDEAGHWTPPLLHVPAKVFQQGMGTLAWFVGERTRRAIRTLPVFLDYLNTDQGFDNTETREMLTRAGLHLPVARDYLGLVLGYYLAARNGRRDPPL